MKRFITHLILLVCVFTLGAFSSTIYAELNHEQPILLQSGIEQPVDIRTPQDWLEQDKIHVYSTRVVIDIKDPEWASFTPTGSMEPVLNHNSNAIEVVPSSQEEIEVGDICSYESKFAQGSIIHRVVYKGQDEDGIYFVFKGDNNPTSDPGRIRFDQVQRCVVAIIY